MAKIVKTVTIPVPTIDDDEFMTAWDELTDRLAVYWYDPSSQGNGADAFEAGLKSGDVIKVKALEGYVFYVGKEHEAKVQHLLDLAIRS